MESYAQPVRTASRISRNSSKSSGSAPPVRVESGDKISIATPSQPKQFRFTAVSSSMKKRRNPVQSNMKASSVASYASSAGSYSDYQTRQLFMVESYRNMYQKLDKVDPGELKWMCLNTLSSIKSIDEHHNLLTAKQHSDISRVESKESVHPEDFIQMRLMLRDLRKSSYLRQQKSEYEGYINTTLQGMMLASQFVAKLAFLKDIAKIITNYKTSILEYCVQHAKDNYEALNGDVSDRKSLMGVAMPIVVSVAGIAIAKVFGLEDMSNMVMQLLNANSEPMSQEEREKAEEDDDMT